LLLKSIMKIFHCYHCQHLVFFENYRCMQCKHPLAFLPDVADIGSLEPVGKERWRARSPDARERLYRLCQNYSRHNVCNWAVPENDAQTLCVSCRLTRVIPDLERPGRKEAWFRLEVAKRRLIYTLQALHLPVASKTVDPDHGLAYEFLADPDQPGAPPVLTGHKDGVITVSLAEADDAEREKRRVHLGEAYRTLLGHFRHEIGHYYWDRLIRDAGRLDGFRQLFGDEREDYGQALRRNYEKGPPADWQQRFVSAYASTHPWEDWAETWAHYLHMTDTLETAAACGLMLRPRRQDEPALPTACAERFQSFDVLIDAWYHVTYVLNELNRGLGQHDGYPFVLSPPAVEKLHFVHDTIASGSGAHRGVVVDGISWNGPGV